MAYKNLVLQACADKNEWFLRMRDFLCARAGTYDYSLDGIGWTLHDSSYAVDEDNAAINDWFVLFSPGENGKEDLYIKLIWISGYIRSEGYLYWDNVSHSGVRGYTAANTMSVAETGSYELFIYGDLDFFTVLETVNASYDYMLYFGKTTGLLYDDTIATSALAVAAGTGVTITLDAVPASWVVGKNIFIRDTASILKITILSISGNDITADLSSSFLAGCKLQADIGYICSSTYYNLNCYALTGHNTTTAALSCTLQTTTTLAANTDPDYLNGEYILYPFRVSGADSYLGVAPHFFNIGLTGLVEKDVLTDGINYYRFFKYYTGIYVAIKEV